jgi:hypothetical protein
LLFAEEKPKKPRWDQDRAEERVKTVLALEASKTTPWDNIPWLTDVKAATEQASKQNKPIFVYWYVHKGSNEEGFC